jgi:hypothetical protein
MTTLGIDLGTSHSSLAFVRERRATLLDIVQIEGPHNIVTDTLLPSVFFHDERADDLRLPWDEHPPILGRYARAQAVLNPERAVTSAKSWLCYKGDQLLPPKAEWGGKSPKEVSALLLSHLYQAYKNTGADEPDTIALAVPASFDPIARLLTEEAAKAAGLPGCELIEEPLAAFYAWLASEPNWNKKLKAGDSVLICDVGGGTSDFSLIVVREHQDELRLDRIAVGRHLLLGGDNMDLALAHFLAQKHGGLDHWQFMSLQQDVRKAKEKLLSDPNADAYAFSVSGRGSSLFASAVRLELTRHEVNERLVEGFFPKVEAHARPNRSLGLQSAGLPYEADPAITKHLAAFLRTALKNARAQRDDRVKEVDAVLNSDQSLYLPTHILFNGGVFKAKALSERVLDTLRGWGAKDLKMLESADLDHAVTLGAAYYAEWKRAGNRLRVRTVSPRSFFIGIEPNGMSVPGFKPPLQGLCVLPQGTEEGMQLQIADQAFALWGGDEVRFQLFSAEGRSDLSTLIPNAADNLQSVAELTTRIGDEEESDGPIPVQLEVEYDTSGTLALRMREQGGARAWKLAFDTREGHTGG